MKNENFDRVICISLYVVNGMTSMQQNTSLKEKMD